MDKRKKIKQQLYKRDVYEMDFSIRARNFFHRAGLNTLGEVFDYISKRKYRSDHEVFRNFGVRSAIEICRIFNEMGLYEESEILIKRFQERFRAYSLDHYMAEIRPPRGELLARERPSLEQVLFTAEKFVANINKPNLRGEMEELYKDTAKTFSG
jgi:hypothetical protein